MFKNSRFFSRRKAGVEKLVDVDEQPVKRGGIFGLLSRKKGGQKHAANEAPKQLDIFGLLPRDIQIEVLGYVAASRPAQVIMMQMVCKRWQKILSEDSIYHSAIFTASFCPPTVCSLKAFRDAAFTDDRIRKHKLYSGRFLQYGVGSKPRWIENNIAQPSKVIYRDGFVVWWFIAGGCFNYVDLNQQKKRKKTHVVDPTAGGTPNYISPLYTQAGGKLVYMWPKHPPRVVEDQSLGNGCILNVVLLQTSPVKGTISLSKIENLNNEPWELYSSSNHALVVRGLEILVINIQNVSKMEVLHTLHLSKQTSLESPVISNIEISNKDNCLIVLSSAETGCLETLAFSLASGVFLTSHSTGTVIEGRKQLPPGTTYFVKGSNEFSQDIPYQAKNRTHKERPPPRDKVHHRWIHIPTGIGSGGECVTGSYNSAPKLPIKTHEGIPSPLARHTVTFGRQGVSFTALQDVFEPCSFTHPVDRISLRIAKGKLGAEEQDTDAQDPHNPSHTHPIGESVGETGTSVYWSRRAKMLTPEDCIVNTREGTSTNTQKWSDQRSQWGQHCVLLGDEKGLVLALPHHMMIWSFETQEIWRTRKKRKIKKLAMKTLYYTALSPGLVMIAPSLLPVACVSGAKKLLDACTKRRSRKKLQAVEDSGISEKE